MKKTSQYLFLGLFIVFVITSASRAQSLVDANPADMFDYKSAIINPGIVPYLSSHMMIGMKAYHIGLIEHEEMDFKNGYFSLSTPFALPGHFGFGVHAQYLITPMVSQQDISLQLARRFLGLVGIGVKANLFGTSYNESTFNLVHPDDPVFANGYSKWFLSGGAGIAIYPFHFITLGVSIDHLNQPDISFLGDGVKKDREIYGGIVLRYGKVRLLSGFTKVGDKIKPNGSLEIGMPGTYFMRCGLINESASLDGQLHIAGPISLNYSYEYPIFDFSGLSSGSLHFGFIYEFSRNPSLPEPVLLDNTFFNFKKPADDIEPEHHFYVYSSEESLEILEKRLQRTVDRGVTREVLARLTNFELGYLDSSRTERPIPFVKKSITPTVDDFQLQGSYSRDYTTALSNLQKNLAATEELKSSIISSNESEKRAVGIRNYVAENMPSLKDRLPIVQTYYQQDVDSLWLGQKQGYRKILPKEQLTLISSKSTTFHIAPVNMSTYSGPWKLTIESANGKTFKEFSGGGTVPKKIDWNWRSDDGMLIKAGFYYYYLTWNTKNGSPVTSVRNRLYVQKLLRTIDVKVTREHPTVLDDANEIDVILKR